MSQAATLDVNSPPAPANDFVVMSLVSLAHGCSHFFQLVLPPLFPFIKDELGVSYTELGLMMTIFYTASGLMQPPAGFMVDRFGARTVLFLGVGIIGTAGLLMSFAPAFYVLVALAIFAGFGNSVFHPADYSILTALVSPARIGRAYGMHTLFGNLGWALAPVLMFGLGSTMGWRTALLVAGAIPLVVLALLLTQAGHLKVSRSVPKAGESGIKGSAALLFQAPILLCFFYFLMLAAALIGLQNFLPSALQARHAIELGIATTALTGYLLGASAGVILGAWLADRSQHHDRVVMAGLMPAALITLMICYVAMPGQWLIAAVTLAGFLMGMTTPSRDMLVRGATPKGAAGRVFGFVYSGLDVGGVIAPYAIGLMLDGARSDLVFWFVAITLVISLLSALSLRTVSSARAAA